MIVQISDFLAVKASRKKEINISFQLEPLNFEGEIIEAIEDVVVVGQIKAQEGVITVNATIKTKLQLQCSRCLDAFIYPIDIDIEERFTKDKDLQDSEEIIFVEGDTLDITEIVENSIISTLPIKRLCKEDCKGLCHQCGVNKNIESCNCDYQDVDIRLAKLRELFGNEEV